MTFTMELKLVRLSSGKESTLGALYINDQWECHVLEDQYREVKVAGETRIPAGEYDITFRESDSPMTKKYRKRYDFFKYHLWIRDVPNFKFCYIHSGNKSDHTEGCLLLGDSANNNQIADGFVGSSRQAFKRVYKKVSKILELDQPVKIFIEEIG